MSDLAFENRPFAIALGEVPNARGVRIFGRVTAPGGGAAYVPVWGVGTAYPYPAAATLLDLSSDSASDTPTGPGTGAHSVYVEGLDANYVEQTETVALNGVGVVTTTKAYIRLRKIQVNACGTALSNVGVITAVNSGGANVLARITAGEGHSNQCIVTVPAGKTMLMLDPSITFGATASVRLRVREFGGAWQSRAYYEGLLFTGGPGALAIPRDYPAKADVVLEASAAAAIVTGEFEALFVS